jgi:hypothetical protein
MGRARGTVDRLGQRGEERRDLLVEAPAFIGQRDRARVAIEQANADLVLEACDRAADTGLGEADAFSSANEAATLDDRVQ